MKWILKQCENIRFMSSFISPPIQQIKNPDIHLLKYFKCISLFALICIFTGCAVKPSIQNTYQLEAFASIKSDENKYAHSIFVSTPLAAEGYETEQMRYVVEPYELSSFAKNAWVGAPARMLFPLIIQSLQSSRYFYAVTSIPYADKANYRLDTQLLTFYQSFLSKPSTLKMSIKNVVTNSLDGHVVSSRIFKYQLPCPLESPYGGVLAANQASLKYTKDLTRFVIKSISQDTP